MSNKMLGQWQEQLFARVLKALPFITRQPLSTFSLACIVGDGLYILNGKVGSLINLGLGEIHPGWLLTMGGVMAFAGHIVLLAAADKVDDGGEQGVMPTLLGWCRAAAKIITLGWKPTNPFMVGFAGLTLNGLAFTFDALWELAFFDATPIMVLQLVNGVVMIAGLGAAMVSRVVDAQQWRDRLNALSPKILAYATILGMLLGVLSLAPFMIINSAIFTIGNAAQYVYAAKVKAMEASGL